MRMPAVVARIHVPSHVLVADNVWRGRPLPQPGVPIPVVNAVVDPSTALDVEQRQAVTGVGKEVVVIVDICYRGSCTGRSIRSRPYRIIPIRPVRHVPLK